MSDKKKKGSDKPSPSLIKNIAVTPRLVKADERIEVTVVGESGGHCRFSIAKVFGATDVPMTENPEQPGSYSGAYVVQFGDNVEDACVTVVFTSSRRGTLCREAEQRVTIDTIPPRIREAKSTRDVVSNGQTLGLKVVAEQRCQVFADLSDLDTSGTRVLLPERPKSPGTYEKRIRVGLENKAPNGRKRITIVATDAAGNGSEPTFVKVDLRNSELHLLQGLSKGAGRSLNRAGIMTLADLRRINVEKVAAETRIPVAVLETHRAAGKLQAIGIDADISLALAKIGGVRGPSDLVLMTANRIAEIIRKGLRVGIISETGADAMGIAIVVQVAGLACVSKYLSAHQENAQQAAETCHEGCADAWSVFSCYSYLIELVRLSPMDWEQLRKRFKQDFLWATTAPVRRIDLSILVLERAIAEDLGNPLRRKSHWIDYDRALNTGLVGLLSEYMEKSAKELPLCFPSHSDAFDAGRPLHDRNDDLANILLHLESKPIYLDELVRRLEERTGKSKAELVHQYPKAFQPGMTVELQTEALQRILGLGRPASGVERLEAQLSVNKLDALIRQCGRPLSWLRRRYHISFTPVVCAETTACRQAILTLQEYLSEQAISYQTYDEWRSELIRRFYPENVYMHQFKESLVRGERKLLELHLDQAQRILDEVRVSADRKEPQDNDLLKSFRWRNPYYTNLKFGLDLIKECWNIDDLMVRGHDAFFSEEYQLARQYYLDAAERIRLTSKKISKRAGDALLPLWTPGGKDRYLGQPPRVTYQAAENYINAMLLSYQPDNAPGAHLARGQVTLSGVDLAGSFKPMCGFKPSSFDAYYDEWHSRLSDFGWIVQKGYWHGSPQGSDLAGTASRSEATEDKGGRTKLFYSLGEWSNIKIELEMRGRTSDPLLGGVIFRDKLTNSASDGGRSGRVGIRSSFLQIGAVGPLVIDTPVASRQFQLDKHHDKYLVVIEVKEATVTAEFSRMGQDGKWAKLETFGATNLPNLRTRGGIALYSDIRWVGGDFHFYNGWACFEKLRLLDLSLATGAVSDAAFFIPPETNIKSRYPVGYLDGAYDERPWAPVETLATKISIAYRENDWIIEPHVVGRDPFDPLGPKPWQASIGLWYGDGDDRLNRPKLGELLDGFPMLFTHQYFFLLPVCLGDVANALGQFEEALDWYRLVYNESEDGVHCKEYRFLNDLSEVEMMRLRIAQNFVDWGDFLYNQNTEESLNQARMKYSLALRTIDTESCCEEWLDHACSIQELGRSLLGLTEGASALVSDAYRTISELATKPGKNVRVQEVIKAVHKVLRSDDSPDGKIERIFGLLEAHSLAVNPHPPLSTVAERQGTVPERLHLIEQLYPGVLDSIELDMRFCADLVCCEHPTLDHQDLVPRSLGWLPQSPWAAYPVVLEGEGAQRPLKVPYEVFRDIALSQLHEKVAPASGLPDLLLSPPEWLPPWGVAAWSADAPISDFPPIWFWFDYCIPQNPVAETLTRRACLSIYHIDNCFNALGFPQNDLSIYRKEYLVAIAKDFAQRAYSTEKDLMQYKEQFEKDRFELMNASQGVAISQAGAHLAGLKVTEARDGVDFAWLGIEKVNTQIALTKQRISELGSDWAIFGTILGAICAAVGSFFTAGAAGAAYSGALATASLAAGAGAAVGGASSYLSGKEENEEDLRMQLQTLKTVDYNAAWQNLRNAIHAEQSSSWQARIAELEAQFAAEKAKFLSTEFFNPQIWSILAREVKKPYRKYLTYGTIAAWLAQRALEFERGIDPRHRFATSGPGDTGAGLNIIRFDYFQPSLQGLLGPEGLQQDIATLEHEIFLNEQRKQGITKVISLAATRPYLFARFLESGQLAFMTALEEFDCDYPGHYQRRIRSVRINLFGLVGQEGIKATLTCLGSSQVVIKEFVTEKGKTIPKFKEKTLRRPPESVAFTSPVGGGIGQIPLVPKEEMLNPFEGMGVAAPWLFEMPKYANQTDFNTITDIQLLIDYTALADPIYREEVLRRLPRIRTGIRPYSFCADFSDACFHLKEGTRPIGMIKTADGNTGAYTLALQTRESDFPPNQLNRRLKEVVVYFRSKDKSKSFAKLEIYLSCKQRLAEENLEEDRLTLIQPALPSNATMLEAATDHIAYNPEPHYLGKWQAEDLNIRGDIGVADTWYLHIPPDADPQQYSNSAFVRKDENGNPVVVNGYKVFDFSDVQDVIFALHYEFDVELPPLT